MSSPEQRFLSAGAAICPQHARTVLAGQEGLEPPTAGFGDRNSSQLSYCPVTARAGMHAPLADHHQLQQCTWQAAPRRTAQLKNWAPAPGLSHSTGAAAHEPGPAEEGPTPPAARQPVRPSGSIDHMAHAPTRISARIAAISESATLAVDAKAKALKAAGRPVIGFGAGEPD